MAVDALLYAVAALLALAGLLKVVRPEATGEALHLVGLPSRAVHVRLLGAVEVAAGASVIAVGGSVPATATAILYGSFTVFVVVQMRRAPDATCGCLGERSPVGPSHVAVNVVATGVAVLGAVVGVGGLPVALEGAGPLVSGLTLAALAAAVGALRMTLTTLPALADAVALHASESSR